VEHLQIVEDNYYRSLHHSGYLLVISLFICTSIVAQTLLIYTDLFSLNSQPNPDITGGVGLSLGQGPTANNNNNQGGGGNNQPGFHDVIAGWDSDILANHLQLEYENGKRNFMEAKITFHPNRGGVNMIYYKSLESEIATQIRVNFYGVIATGRNTSVQLDLQVIARIRDLHRNVL